MIDAGARGALVLVAEAFERALARHRRRDEHDADLAATLARYLLPDQSRARRHARHPAEAAQ